MPGASPWPPPPVTEKDYAPQAGSLLLWSKFNGDRRLAGPAVEELMAGIGDLVDLLLSAEKDDDGVHAAAEAAFEARLAANKPKKKKSSTAVLEELVDKGK